MASDEVSHWISEEYFKDYLWFDFFEFDKYGKRAYKFLAALSSS